MELDHKQIAEQVLKHLGGQIAGGLVGKDALDSSIEAIGKKLDVGVKAAAAEIEERIKGTHMEPLLLKIKELADRNDKLDAAIQESQKQSEHKGLTFDVKSIRDAVEAFSWKNERGFVELSQEQSQALNARVKTLATTAGGSFGPYIQPQVQAGIIPPVLRRLMIESLFESDPISVPTFRYIRESSRTNSAASVAEGAAKPESAVVLAAVDGKVEVIAHHIPMTKQLAADVPGSLSYIEAALVDGVRRATETQLLTGDGVSPNLGGILLSGNFTAYGGPAIGADWTFAPASSANTSLLDKIAHMIFSQLYTADFAPTGMVIHGANILAMLMTKDTTGNYVKALGGEVVNVGQDGVFRLFGVPVATTNNATPFNNKALVGDFSKLNAQIFDRENITVTMGWISDDFTKNQFRILVERRLGLAVRRPAAFIYG